MAHLAHGLGPGTLAVHRSTSFGTQRSPIVVGVAALVGILALGTTLTGLFVPVDGTVEAVEPARGDRVELYGEGIY